MTLQLYPFQEKSIEKFLATAKEGYPNVLNADDMGLGKTVQAVALDQRRRKDSIALYHRKTLVVAPLSVLSVWENHFKAWNPSLKTYTVDPKARGDFVAAAQSKKYDVLICHWASLRLMPELQKVKWFHIIADEVHKAKNRKAQQTVSLKKLRAEYKTGLSGTPADNRPDDFWSVLNWLYPTTFSSYWRFFNYHCLVIYHDETGTSCGCNHGHKRPYREVAGTANEDELKKQLAPFYIRRRKEEVLKDLPDKYYSTIQVDLAPQQLRAYREMSKSMLAWVGEHEDQPVAAPIAIAQLTRLQQFACAYGRLETSTKRRRNCVADDCLKAGKCLGHPVTSLRLSDPSSKIDAATELIANNPNEQFVVFGQSKQAINLLAERLRKANETVCLLTGDTPKSDRGTVVERFQTGKARIFAGTIAAGGEGITLTAASRGVFLDRTWSPSHNRQAEDRLHRIGQKNAVHITDIVARGTVDLGRLQQIRLKWAWIKAILGDPLAVQDEFLAWTDDFQE